MVLTGNMNGRSSVDFTDKANNVTAFVPKGTHGEVLEVRKLKKTGSYGIKMKVTEVTTKPTNAKNAVKKDQEIWVYFSSTKSPWLKFKDTNGSTVQDPEEALTAQAKRDGQALPALPGTIKNPTLPTQEEVERNSVDPSSIDPNLEMKDRNQTEGGWCPMIPCSISPSFNEKNIQQVEDVMKQLPPASEVKPAKKTPAQPKVEKVADRSPKTEAVDPQNIWANESEILNYSNGDGTKLIKHAMANKLPRSTSYCYRRVKRYLLSSKLTTKYLPGRHARDSVQALKKEGWTNLLDDPRYKDKIKSPADVPKGAIMVSWTKEDFESGDIQVKKDWGGKPGWISDFYDDKPIQQQSKGRRKAKKGKPYQMIGVMVKLKK